MTDKMTPMAVRTKEEKNKWQLQPICKGCYYRRELRGFKYAVKDWCNTCCCYILIEGQLRGCQPHGNYCERYKPRPKRKGLD